MSVATRLALATEGFRGGEGGGGGGSPIVISGIIASLLDESLQVTLQDPDLIAVVHMPEVMGGTSGNLTAVLDSPSFVATISDPSLKATLGSC